MNRVPVDHFQGKIAGVYRFDKSLLTDPGQGSALCIATLGALTEVRFVQNDEYALYLKALTDIYERKENRLSKLDKSIQDISPEQLISQLDDEVSELVFYMGMPDATVRYLLELQQFLDSNDIDKNIHLFLFGAVTLEEASELKQSGIRLYLFIPSTLPEFYLKYMRFSFDHLEKVYSLLQPEVVFPVLPGVNSDDMDIDRTAKYLSSRGLRKLKVVPFFRSHKMNKLPPISEAQLKVICEQFSEYDLDVKLSFSPLPSYNKTAG